MGYESHGSYSFRPLVAHQVMTTTEQSTPSLARKCSMPIRVPNPITGVLPPDVGPTEITAEKSNELALRALLYDLCHVSTNRSMSRSYMPHLEAMALGDRPNSQLVKACHAVSFGSHAKYLNRPRLRQLAEDSYQDVLELFWQELQDPNATKSVQTRTITTLLGLYEVGFHNSVDQAKEPEAKKSRS